MLLVASVFALTNTTNAYLQDKSNIIYAVKIGKMKLDIYQGDNLSSDDTNVTDTGIVIPEQVLSVGESYSLSNVSIRNNEKGTGNYYYVRFKLMMVVNGKAKFDLTENNITSGTEFVYNNGWRYYTVDGNLKQLNAGEQKLLFSSITLPNSTDNPIGSQDVSLGDYTNGEMVRFYLIIEGSMTTEF